jgi:curved DNA-binding protein
MLRVLCRYQGEVFAENRMEFKDYYKIMGVERGASQDEIKRAYRKLARKYHPDVSKEGDAEARFKEIGEAYAVLKDPEKRASYDELGQNWKSGQEFRPPPNWDAGFEFRGGAGQGQGGADFSDFFETLFGRGGFSAGARPGRSDDFRARGEDHHARAVVSLEDAYTGATRTIALREPQLDDSGHVVLRERNLKVNIPKGVREGQRIRLSGQGSPGRGNAPAGDLYLEIAFEPHPLYTVDGRDVYLDLPVTPWEAALGGKVEAPTPTGPVDLTIPAGAVNGRKLRLKGRGIPGATPGDLYAVLKLTIPPADNDAARDLYREMERKLAYNPRSNLGVGAR